jgi:beta-lactamase superfamily II metal-dependent hydrolase
MTAAANTSSSSRTATVTVTATTSGVSGSPKTITVTQAGAANPMKYVCLKVGQGDAAVLVSPTGKYALIDGGLNNTYGLLIWKFLRDSLRTHHLDYIFTSHYHSDHIGGTDLVIDSLCAHGLDSIIVGAYDRGGSYGTGTDYTNYVNRTGSKRRTAYLGQVFDMGGGLTVQVVSMNGKTISGDSVVIPADEENGKSMGLLISCNGFRLITAGDIAGYNSGDYKNVESILAPDIGPVNVLHVNHHSSASSSNPTWVSTLDPQASLISLGDGNPYGYPKAETLTRLTSDPGMDNYIYQTETGTGAAIPAGRGQVCNSNIWVVVNSASYTVNGRTYSIAKGGDVLAAEPESSQDSKAALLQALVHPNPISGGRATVSFRLPSPGEASVEIYNLVGQRVRTLERCRLEAGRHQFSWDCQDDFGRRLAGGVYLLRLSIASNGQVQRSSRKVLLVR